ncbi:MAG TPA: HAD-IA family hydrolase [Candidatus Limnocylindria bacterium]|nr:HAD-IA family hydrolase [Candidatus Limnocylindria bacterium]
MQAASVRAVLWDLDGTLTDSVRFVVDTANRVIEAHGGAPLPFESVGAMTGLPLEEIFRMAWPDLTPDDARRYRSEYRDIYDREMIPATKLYDGARETLRTFHDAGLLQATVTGKRAADCERILRGLGIAGEIDVYLGGDSVTRPKPAPDLAQHAMERLGCTPTECVVVGDANADIAMGKSAGAHTIQVLWGFARRRLDGADHVVATWPALRDAVFALAGRSKPILRRGGALGS